VDQVLPGPARPICKFRIPTIIILEPTGSARAEAAAQRGEQSFDPCFERRRYPDR
jgi:hypothetical protein